MAIGMYLPTMVLLGRNSARPLVKTGKMAKTVLMAPMEKMVKMVQMEKMDKMVQRAKKEIPVTQCSNPLHKMMTLCILH